MSLENASLKARISELTDKLQASTEQNADTTNKLRQVIDDTSQKSATENAQKASIMETLVRSSNAR